MLPIGRLAQYFKCQTIYMLMKKDAWNGSLCVALHGMGHSITGMEFKRPKLRRTLGGPTLSQRSWIRCNQVLISAKILSPFREDESLID
ncbi:MAG: hypothetical protein ACJAQT_002664 [Akkermansiaceae bacterium]